MNADQLKKRVGAHLRLRPLPIRIANDGRALDPIDDDWFLAEVLAKPARVRLDNSATGHTIVLEADNIKEYRSPHFLILRCQLTISAVGISIEPILSAPAAEQIRPLEDGTYRFHVVVRGFTADVRAFLVDARKRFGIGLISGAYTDDWGQASFGCFGKHLPERVAILARKHGLDIKCASQAPV